VPRLWDEGLSSPSLKFQTPRTKEDNDIYTSSLSGEAVNLVGPSEPVNIGTSIVCPIGIPFSGGVSGSLVRSHSRFAVNNDVVVHLNLRNTVLLLPKLKNANMNYVEGRVVSASPGYLFQALAQTHSKECSPPLESFRKEARFSHGHR